MYCNFLLFSSSLSLLTTLFLLLEYLRNQDVYEFNFPNRLEFSIFVRPGTARDSTLHISNKNQITKSEF